MRQTLETSLRGSGRTTAQMRRAPANAVFIWCNVHLDYPRRLAKRLGRDDLTVVSPSWLLNDSWGISREVVLDHATVLSPAQVVALIDYQARQNARRQVDGRK